MDGFVFSQLTEDNVYAIQEMLENETPYSNITFDYVLENGQDNVVAYYFKGKTNLGKDISIAFEENEDPDSEYILWYKEQGGIEYWSTLPITYKDMNNYFYYHGIQYITEDGYFVSNDAYDDLLPHSPHTEILVEHAYNNVMRYGPDAILVGIFFNHKKIPVVEIETDVDVITVDLETGKESNALFLH